MKVFTSTHEYTEKINFVDENNVLVGFENDPLCCENFGWFLSKHPPNLPNDGAVEIDTDGYNFDTTFFRKVEDYDAIDFFGGMVTFKLQKDGEVIFLSLYNSQNGYYSHGFEMEVEGVKIQDGTI